MQAHPDFQKVTLDGSALEYCWYELARRLKGILSRAIEAKRTGIGVFARPEADPALMKLLAVLHHVEPDAGWLDAAMLTYAWSLDDALRRAPEVWWGHDWLDVLEKSYPLRWSMVNALLDPNPLPSPEVTRVQFIHAMEGRHEPEVLFKLPESSAPRRRRIYDEVIARLNFARGFMMRPDKSYPKVKPVALGPVAAELGQPLWRNLNAPPMPEPAVAYLRRFGHVVMRTLSMTMDGAAQLLTLSGCYLGTLELPGSWGDEIERPHTRYFCGTQSLGTWHKYLLGPSVLDRLFGAAPESLLNACFATSRITLHEVAWTDEPGRLHVGKWDTALLSVLVDDRAALKVWSQRVPETYAGFPPGTRACCELLRCWIESKPPPDGSKLPKSLDKVESAFASAVLGLMAGDAPKVSEGVRTMLANYRRIDYRDVWGQWFSDLCLQAVALQRAALRAGLAVEVPEERPNDPQLVRLPDCGRGELPWSPFPGVDLLGNTAQPLQWPTLLLNRQVREVLEPGPL